MLDSHFFLQPTKMAYLSVDTISPERYKKI